MAAWEEPDAAPGESTGGGDIDAEDGGGGMGMGKELGAEGICNWGGEGDGWDMCSESWACWELRLDWLPDLDLSGLGGGLGRELPLKLWQ